MRSYGTFSGFLASLLLLLLLPIEGRAQSAGADFPAFYRVVGVAQNDVLNIRHEPSARAAIFGHLRPDAVGIEVVGLSPDGAWGAVNSGEASGWVALRYLEREDRPRWQSGETGLVCWGTEPFWGLDLNLPGRLAEYRDPELEALELAIDAPPLPMTPFPPSLAVPLSGGREGIAVLRGGACSDGMSDLLSGIEVQVYWRGNRSGLSGCCRLSAAD